MPQLLRQYENQGYHYAKYVYDVDGVIKPAANGNGLTITFSTIDDAPIYYTLDGSVPTEKSNLYKEPVKLDHAAKIRAAAIRPSGRSFEWSDSLSFSKSTGAAVTLSKKAHSRYRASGPGALTDGRYGSSAFNDDHWVGNTNHDTDAVIDLGRETEISSVAFNTNVNTPNWIFDTPEVIVEVSDDGKNFRRVAAETYPVAEDHKIEIVKHKVDFDPTAARYVRVLIKRLESIPAFHGEGAGKPAWVFVDEIEVN